MADQDDDTPFARADALHRRATVLLAHDHMARLQDLRRDREGGITAKVVQAAIDARIFSDSRAEYEKSLYCAEGFMRDAMEAFDNLLGMAESHPAEFQIVRKAGDIAAAKVSGRLGVILGAEGGKLLEGSTAALRNFHRLGMRHLQLNWAIRNQLGTAQSTPDEPGLTDFGREVVAEMNRLGMVIDVSHSSPQTISDVLSTTAKPIINSHSGSRAICNKSQNLSDREIRGMADNGGVVAVHFGSGLVVSGGRQATIDDLLAQIEHVSNVGGIDCVGLGPDYFQYADFPLGRNVMRNQGNPPMPWTKNLEDSSKLPNLTRALVERSFGDEDILKILGGNLLRVFEAVLV